MSLGSYPSAYVFDSRSRYQLKGKMMFPYCFIVDKTTGEILSVVERNVQPPHNSGSYFVRADRVSLTFYYRLTETQDTVYISEVIKV